MSDRLDATRRGAREFTQPEEDRVLRIMYVEAQTPGVYLTTVAISKAANVEGRTVRAILSHHDGRSFVLCGGDDGVRIARWLEEAEPMTARLRSTAETLLSRADRRAKFPLPARQPKLPGMLP